MEDDFNCFFEMEDDLKKIMLLQTIKVKTMVVAPLQAKEKYVIKNNQKLKQWLWHRCG